ncbi:MAG: hypothetical protein HY280_00790 [Nitrospinae bacterium]|nr:hypothetical protein [Nitrospinota bacterium]
MKPFLMLAVLIGGIYLAVKATKWANHFAFGENRERLEKGKRDKADQ